MRIFFKIGSTVGFLTEKNIFRSIRSFMILFVDILLDIEKFEEGKIRNNIFEVIKKRKRPNITKDRC